MGLAAISFLIGLALSSVLLHFIFGDIVYSRYYLIGLLAPSNYFLKIGYVTSTERLVFYVIDASIFGVIIYFTVRLIAWSIQEN